ncbi:MAG: hypothetical protein J0H69_23075 [Burkholderiales bacterium]|jgi:hypothetical protein|nr:hypothetical protein [Burkholderiales bacterium]
MKPKLTSIALVVGLSAALGPWIFLEIPSKHWYWFSLCGLGIAAVAGYDSQARMLGLGDPGENLLEVAFRWARKFFRK